MEDKNKVRGFSIIISFSLMASGTIILTALLTSYFIKVRNDRFFNSEVWKNSQMVAETLSAEVIGSLSISDPDAFSSSIADVIGDNPQIVDLIVVLKKETRVFYDMYRDREGETFSDKMKKPGLDYLSVPIMLETGFSFGMEATREEVGELMLGVKYEDFLSNERIRAIVSFAQNLSKRVAEAVESGAFIQVRDMMGILMSSRTNILYAELMQNEGIVLFYAETGLSDEKAQEKEGELEESEIGKRALEVSAARPVMIQHTEGGTVLDISVPVMSRGKKLGVVRIGYSMGDFLEAQKRSRNLLAAIAGGLVIAGFLCSLFISIGMAKPIRTLAAAAHRIGEGDLDQKVNISSGGREIRELGVSFNKMIAGLRERDFVKDTFSRYVTKQVADEILKNPESITPGGKKQEVTILFSDIRGFTTFSESHEPEEVISHLNEYLSAMVDVIFKYEGTLDKYIGDAIMAVFGSPLRREDDPLRAVKTALEMQQRISGLNEKWEKEGKEQLTVGIGVNTGDVIAGNIGDIRRMEYTVIGDNVNLASRIESLTKNFKCPIIISASTYEEVKDHVSVNKLESVTVKGKTQAVEIYELLDSKS